MAKEFSYRNDQGDIRGVQVLRRAIREICGRSGSGHDFAPMLDPPPKCTHVCTCCGAVRCQAKPKN